MNVGQDFLRRKNDRFVRQRDQRFAEQTCDDLLAVIPPAMVVSLCGTAVGPVTLAQELWTPEVTGDGPIEFYYGEQRAVRLDGAAAKHLRDQCADSHSQVVAQVVDLEHDHGLVTIKIGVSS